uniref:protein SHORT ROOT IN SALT MEDIUM 1-like isoform X2 n=1 Tax=Erigeron canadensis TaxID=72917 RepID=UPI001CB95571|nr:protein SHORT ROOT IN SALT MEDIUM 1-like isoform X2 [Erigeron canadensis]
MYSSRENNNKAYGQPSKPQLYSPSRHAAALLGGHSSAGAHGSQYTLAYGSSAFNSALQVPATSVKGAGSSVLEGRSGYDSTMQDSPKYASRDYAAATQKYGQKGEKLYPDKLNDYLLEDRLPYAERLTSYSGRDLQNEAAPRFADSIAFGRQRQTDIYDRYDAATVLRKDLLLTQSLQPASVDGGPRQADFLSARAATVRHAGQELLPYGGRMDADFQTLSRISGTQHAPSILCAPGLDVEDLVYSHSSANPGYGVSLPPGRAYSSGKALHGTSLDSDYPGGILTRGSYARFGDKADVPSAMEVERREEDLRFEILREREQERARERDRERERERQRDREREHEWERERERERERRRERERERERQVKDKDRELKRAPEVRLERTPPRSSRDRGRSSSAMARRSLRLESPLIEASHRRPSRVKEKRREYVCKVYSSNVADIERDYLSMDKRYPRLYVSPECSKVVVNWSRENLNVPFNTPISFEHDFVLEEKSTEHVSASTKALADAHVRLETGTTRWNAKMLLMSGLSHNAWEELSSERNYEDRIPHLCNMLRFAFLKDGNSIMAIGGSWDTVDGNDPSVDKSALVQTLLRYSKEFTSLDFKNCRHWNPFLEFHYDRVGKDGLFSHKEVTVLYIPDLSDCLPSIDAWRAQWYAHKKSIEERERLHALKREKLREKEDLKEKEAGTTKILKKVEKTEKKKETGSTSEVNDKEKAGIESKAKEVGKGKAGTKDRAKEAGKEEGNILNEKKAGLETVDEGNSSGKKTQKEVSSPGSGKKITKKVTKKKVAHEDVAENAPKHNDTRDSKNVEKAGATSSDVIGEGTVQSVTPSTFKTSTTKKVAKESMLVKTVEKDNVIKEFECSGDKPKNKEGAGATMKTAIKKKIIKRVAKKKVASEDANDKNKVGTENKEGAAIVEENLASGDQESEVKLDTNQSVFEQQKVMGGSSEIRNKGGNNQVADEKKTAKKKIENEDNNVKSKDGIEKKVEDGKAESRVKRVKDKKKVEEPPRHPGLILKTKGGRSTKLRSLSLSLDSLLDYSDKDIEESTFELSIFAETFYEMLQYQMGSRILMFLQKLRIKFVAKRNQKKRQREEKSDNKKEKSSSAKKSPKRQKTEDVTAERKSVKTETVHEGSLVDEETVRKEESMLIDNVEIKPEDESKPEEEPDEDPEGEPEEDPEEEEPVEDPEEELEEDPEEELEEDPEEDPEEIPDEDEVMADANPKNDANNDEKAEADKVNLDVKSINVEGKVKDEQEDKAKVTAGVDAKSEAENKKGTKMDIKKKEKETPIIVNVKVKDEQKDSAKTTVTMDTKSDAGKKEDTKVIKGKKAKETPVSINKELLQAFRFFDRNRVGYIRVEDLRLILHALGNSISHRDVKELVQSALLESNTGRDDRILYNKLVKMTRV